MIRAIEDLGDWPTMRWRKAKASNPSGNCVEVATHAGQILIRHSKQPEGPALVFTQEEWLAFLIGAQRFEFNPEVLG